MFECHITIEYIEPGTTEHDNLKSAADHYGFRVARLYKWNKEHSDLDTFMTGHDSDYDNILDKMRNLVDTLETMEYTVTRYKIEQILLDSKNGDSI